MRRRSPALLCGALVAVVLMAGCGSGSSGAGATGSASRTSSTSPSTASAAGPALDASRLPPAGRTALGDLRTIDPCSLVDLATFATLGAASYGDPQSMDYCTVEVSTDDGQEEAHVGELVDAAAGSSPPAVTRGQPGGDSCVDQVTFTDRLALTVSVVPPEGATSTAVTCRVADAALAGAIAAIGAGHVAHRTYPARSYGPVDPCTALAAAAVDRALPALAGTRAVGHPARHQCEFGSRSATTTYAALVLGAAYQRFDGGPTSTTITVHGHRVVMVPTQPTGRPTECTGYGPHIAYPSRSGQPAMEMAELHVSLPDGAPEAKACQDVAALATAVFTRLP